MDKTKIMLAVLGLIDVIIISNPLIMVIIGGYDIFMSKLGIEGHEDEPEWLNYVNIGVLKVKLSIVLISISSIHLFKTSTDVAQRGTHMILRQVTIHVMLLVSALVVAWMDHIASHVHPHGEAANAH